MAKAILAAGLVGVYVVGIASTLAKLAGWPGSVLAIASAVPVGIGLYRLTKRQTLLWLAILAGLFAASTTATVVPALALHAVGETVTCQVTDWTFVGRKGRSFQYDVRCPNGTPTEVKTTALTRELGRRAIEVGEPVELLRDNSGWWKPDTVQSNEKVRESLWRWIGMLALPVVLLVPIAVPTPTTVGTNP